MNLLYNTTATGMSNTEMYNGNISAMQWRTNLGLADVKMRGYTFSYDPMNRLLDAAPRHYNGTWAANTLNREGTLTYDLNGNIRTLQRTQAAGTSMDNLSYDYGTGTNAGNRLRNVKDTSFDDEGFKDNTGGSDDYVYDSNGNMTADGNKGIGIGYNLLNLPNIVVNAAGDRIFYIYDAGGRKLSQVLANSGGAQRKVTDYHGEYIYENDTLKFASHEEGRIIMTGAAPEYQYHLKDHLGNVRMTYTTKDETVESKATMETPNQAAEYGQFINYDKARMINHVVYDHTYNGQTPPNGSAYAVRLNGSAKERIGLAKSLSVMPGDKLKIEVFAKYYEPPQSGNPGLFATLMAAIIGGTQPGGTFVDGTGYATNASTTVPYGNALYKGSETAGAPKAYLNWLIFDRKHNVIASQSSFKRITTAAKEDTTDVAHERLAPQGDYIEIKEPGYAYIWISNENEVPVEVYFDDFKVEHVKSPIVSSQDYYPFGLSFNSYNRENGVLNFFQYNSKELQDELGLGWLDYQARQYDPSLGRFLSVDPAADMMRRFSPYVYALNNPLRFIDPDGMLPEDTHNKHDWRADISEEERLDRIADHEAMISRMDRMHEAEMRMSNSSQSGKERRAERRSKKGPGDEDDLTTPGGRLKAGWKTIFWWWGKPFRKLRAANVLIIGNGSGWEDYGTKELGLGETFVLDLSNPDNILSLLSKLTNSNLLGSGFAVVETKENRGAVLYLDHVPKDGETIDGWKFTDCSYSAGQVGGQIHASRDNTQAGYIYKIHQDDNGGYFLVKAGQHE